MKADRTQETQSTWLVWLGVIASIYLLLVAVGTITAGFQWAVGGAGAATELFRYADNPFMGLVIGAFATALVQSSSTVTSVIVALVAAGLPVSAAIPMVMGANIGTTVTNTLVSMGHAGDTTEFQRAFAAATIHDFFNVLSVLIFLPLELMFGFLEKTSAALMELFMFDGSASIKGFNFISSVTKPVINAMGRDGLLGSVLPGSAGGAVMIVVGVALIFLSIRQMGSLLNKVMVGRAEEIFHAAIGRGALTGILAGAVMTIVVQSSSTTTSLIVPLAGAGMLALDRVYPFTLGANIGTCITSLLAATAITGPMAVPALQVALVHLLYNTLGVIVIYGIPWLRRIPLICAEWLSGMTVKRKSFAVVYVVGAFFVAPAALVGLSMLAPAPMVAEDPLPGVTEAELLEIEEDAEEMSEEFPDFAVE